ncbi:MAG: hypothetical protein M3328_10050, partial [Chloroflexota bacterium]|nr:hypothetical protein [Chloroflexota bacterium]
KKKELEAINNETWAEPEPPPALRPAPAKPALQQPKQPRQTAGQAGKQESPGRKPAAASSNAPSAQQSERTCPVCKATVRPQAVFCASCGYKIGPA